MENETIFADGFIFKRPHQNAPDFVKGSMSIKADEAIEFIRKHTKPDGWVNLDLNASKDNTKLYFKLNTFTPKQTDSTPTVAGEDTRDVPDLTDSDIPF